MPIGIGEPLLATHLTLMSLVDRALQGSLDLRQANACVREARVRRGISAAERFPILKASGAMAKPKSGEITGTGQENEIYTAGFDASWEIDVSADARARPPKPVCRRVSSTCGTCWSRSWQK